MTASPGTVSTPIAPHLDRTTTALVRGLIERSLAAGGLIVLIPVLAVIGVAIRLDSPGPAIFRQIRIGRGGRPFTFYKFRGMFMDSRARFPRLYDYRWTAEELPTTRFHPEHDPRVTRVGRLLRRTSLDELPNLVNVVLGDMSLVGPRPEIPELIPYYGEAAAAILSVRPGITSPAKLQGRDDYTFQETLAADLEYVRTRSLVMDARVLIGTVVRILTGRNVGR